MDVINPALVQDLTTSHGPFLKLARQKQASDGSIITVFQWDQNNNTLVAQLLAQLEAEKTDYPYVPEQGWWPLVQFDGYKPADGSAKALGAFVVFQDETFRGIVAILPNDPVKAIYPSLVTGIEGQFGPFLSGLPDTDEHNPDEAVVELARAARAFVFEELNRNCVDLLTGVPAEGLTKLLGAPFKVESGTFTYFNERQLVIATFERGCDDEQN